MTDPYSIDELIKTFSRDAILAEKNHLDLEEKYFKEYGQKLPYSMDFNICRAFLAMCMEIKMLKENNPCP
jgi:hypothetical protein